MKIKPRSLLIGERSKQLDTSEYRGGLEYNGDSMMIADTIKKRKELKNSLLKNKEKNDDEQIKGYLRNEIPDYYDLKSLEEMVKKYRTMSH